MAITMGSLSPDPTSRIFLGPVQDISNGFVAAASGPAPPTQFGELVSRLPPTSIRYELGTSAFGTDVGTGTVAQNLVTAISCSPTATVTACTTLLSSVSPGQPSQPQPLLALHK